MTRFPMLALVVLAACAGEPADAPAASTPTASTEAAPTPGALAPDFTLVDTHGAEHTLSDYRGQVVVLEWLNYDCPYVGKHYGGGTMQRLQTDATDDGVVWLSVVSSAPGKQGYFEPVAMNARTEAEGGRQEVEGDRLLLLGFHFRAVFHVVDDVLGECHRLAAGVDSALA